MSEFFVITKELRDHIYGLLCKVEGGLSADAIIAMRQLPIFKPADQKEGENGEVNIEGKE